MRFFSRDIDDLNLKGLKRLRDYLEESLAEDRVELENELQRMTENERNKYAIERHRILVQCGIERDEVKLQAVNELIANIEAETASTAP